MLKNAFGAKETSDNIREGLNKQIYKVKLKIVNRKTGNKERERENKLGDIWRKKAEHVKRKRRTKRRMCRFSISQRREKVKVQKLGKTEEK